MKYNVAFLFAAMSSLRSSELCQLAIDDTDESKRMIVPEKESSTEQTWVTFSATKRRRRSKRSNPSVTLTMSVCSRPRSNPESEVPPRV
ncbi:hypothetical protein [Halorubrum coriense]|uniref:hypothetical protein n=1 Tax=Halorubrum coriense TaxID=64713 RepID=UPI0012693141|nr:hypothetical protein [Halorubrum coriense]